MNDRDRQNNTQCETEIDNHTDRNRTTHGATDIETQQARTTEKDPQIASRTRQSTLRRETTTQKKTQQQRERETENEKTVDCVLSLMQVDILSQQRKLFMNFVPIDKVVLK